MPLALRLKEMEKGTRVYIPNMKTTSQIDLKTETKKLHTARFAKYDLYCKMDENTCKYNKT